MEKQKILIADDSEMNRALLIDILEEQYEVAEAENGVEAISILSRHRTDYSLLLLGYISSRHRVASQRWREGTHCICSV